MNISIERQAKISVQEQVKLEIAQRIRSGLLAEGQHLPSVRELSQKLQISLVTAHRVYQILQKDGLIESVRGNGTFVKRTATRSCIEEKHQVTSSDSFKWQASIPDYLPRASFWSQSAVRLPADILDLATASIHHTLLPLDLLQASIKQALQQYPQSLGRYSPYQGDSEFLDTISDYLKTQGILLSARTMIVTNGTQQAIDIFARTFLGPRDVIALETPCFSGTIDAFRLCGAIIQPVPIDHDGIRVDALEELSLRMQIKAVYTVPTFQNPTGSIMSLRRRKELLEFAENNNVLLLEDDPHRELTQSSNIGKMPPTIKSLDQSGRVIYLKGFSKFLFPGFRLGVIFADGTIYNRLLATKSIADLGSPLWLQKSLIPFFANSHLNRYIKQLNKSLECRSHSVHEKLAKDLNKAISYQKNPGGMHLWITMPPAISTDNLVPTAHREGIHFLPGSIFYPGEPETNHLRICWTNLSDDDLPKALDILCKILNNAVG